MNIADVNVLDGEWHAEKPVIIIDAETAWEAVIKGEIEQLVRNACSALSLSGKQVVFLEKAAE
jgi:hypothetical protein